MRTTIRRRRLKRIAMHSIKGSRHGGTNIYNLFVYDSVSRVTFNSATDPDPDGMYGGDPVLPSQATFPSYFYTSTPIPSGLQDPGPFNSTSISASGRHVRALLRPTRSVSGVLVRTVQDWPATQRPGNSGELRNQVQPPRMRVLWLRKMPFKFISKAFALDALAKASSSLTSFAFTNCRRA